METKSVRSELGQVRLGVGLLILAFVAQANVVAFNAGNWDEYHYLSHVHEYLRGELPTVLQTFHARLFAWLPWVGLNETDQILAARTVLLLSYFGTCLFAFRIASRFTDTLSGLFATLSYASFSFTLLHGTSFRPDPIVAFLLMGALERLTAPREGLSNLLLAALLCAIAAAVTIKSAVYAPFIAATILLQRAPLRGKLLRLALFTGVCVGAFALLIGWHGMGLSIDTEAEAVVSSAISKTFLSGETSGRWLTFVVAVFSNLAFWIPVIVGIGSAVLGGLSAEGGSPRSRHWRILLFALPVSLLLVYRNSFPYFYPFLLAPVSLVAAVGWERLLRRRAGINWYPILVLLIGMNISLHGLVKPHLSDVTLADQRGLLDEVHKLFPDEVAYIDRCSMVSSYRKVGFFMSTWGKDHYLAAGMPIFADILDAEQPKFILANEESLYVGAEFEQIKKSTNFSLLEADLELLRRNYVHHWGPLFVAGKRLELGDGAESRDFNIIVAGPYTVESEDEVVLDGKTIAPGAVVELAQGLHSIGTVGHSGTVTLRYGEKLPVPDQTFDHVIPFKGFN